MNPVRNSVALAAADDDGVAQNQTPGAAGNLTLNGALVSGGVGILHSSLGVARAVLVTTASDESGKTLTIYGTNHHGEAISETMTGPNATTGSTSLHFRTVTRVAVSAAFTGNVKVGTSGVGSSSTTVMDIYAMPFNAAIGCTVSGTVNYTVQYTFDNPNVATALNWNNHATIASKSAAFDGVITSPVTAVRTLINSGTGTVTTNILQATGH